MSTTIQLGEISILMTKKDIKNVHLSVHPPDGRVTLVAPNATRIDVARAYAISKLGWIRQQQEKVRSQARDRGIHHRPRRQDLVHPNRHWARDPAGRDSWRPRQREAEEEAG